jgi:hypothetical protein
MAFLGCARGHSVEYGDSGREAHRAYQFNRYSPSNPSVTGNRWPCQHMKPGTDRLLPETLKRLAVSVVLGRNVLPSSKEST